MSKHLSLTGMTHLQKDVVDDTLRKQQPLTRHLREILIDCSEVFKSAAKAIVYEAEQNQYSDLRVIIKVANIASATGYLQHASALYSLALTKIIESRKSCSPKMIAQIMNNLCSNSRESHCAAVFLEKSVYALLNQSSIDICAHMEYLEKPIDVILSVLELMNDSRLEHKESLIEYIYKIFMYAQVVDKENLDDDLLFITTHALQYRLDRELAIEVLSEVKYADGDIVLDQMMKREYMTPALNDILLAFHECMSDLQPYSKTLQVAKYTLERNKVYFEINAIEKELANFPDSKESMKGEDLVYYGGVKIQLKKLEERLRRMKYEIIELAMHPEELVEIKRAYVSLAKQWEEKK